MASAEAEKAVQLHHLDEVEDAIGVLSAREEGLDAEDLEVVKKLRALAILVPGVWTGGAGQNHHPGTHWHQQSGLKVTPM